MAEILQPRLDWHELSVDFLALQPAQQLQVLTGLSGSQSAGAPWLAVVLPVDREHEYAEVSLSLVGAWRFSEAVTHASGAAAQRLKDLTTAQEADGIRKAQESRGNPPEAMSIAESSLAFIVPGRLVGQAKELVQQVLAGVRDAVEPSGDPDYD